MNTRLIWNFDIACIPGLEVQDYEREELSWEARYFWPETATICLQNLDGSFLDLSLYTIKHRKDRYYLLPNLAYNIKERNSKLLYKPLIETRCYIDGFAKKIELNKTIEDHGQLIQIDKIVLKRKLETKPPIKFELARLVIQDKVYFTASIEGHSYDLVKDFSDRVFPDLDRMSYVRFLGSLRTNSYE